MTTEIDTSPWGLVTHHYSYPITPPVADMLLSLRGGLSLGCLGNLFWRPQRPTNVIQTQTPETSVSPREACRQHGAGPAMLVEPRTGREWLWPDTTGDSRDPPHPFCWDAVVKPPIAYVFWCYRILQPEIHMLVLGKDDLKSKFPYGCVCSPMLSQNFTLCFRPQVRPCSSVKKQQNKQTTEKLQEYFKDKAAWCLPYDLSRKRTNLLCSRLEKFPISTRLTQNIAAWKIKLL